MDQQSRDLAAVLRGLRTDVDGLWGAVRRRGFGGGGGTAGPEGPPGAAAGFGTPGASASGLAAGANPTASVTASGPDTAKIFQFSFGIPAGAAGPPGPAANVRTGAGTFTTNATGGITITFSPPFTAGTPRIVVNVNDNASPTANVVVGRVFSISLNDAVIQCVGAWSGGIATWANAVVYVTWIATV